MPASTHRRSDRRHLALLLFCLTRLAGCSDEGITSSGTEFGAAKITVQLTALAARSEVRIEAAVSAADMDTLRQDLTMTSPLLASGVIEGIPVGVNRKLELAVYSDEDVVTHYGFVAGLTVANAETLAVEIALLPLTGSISAIGNLLKSNDPVRYSVRFDAMWSAMTHPDEFPSVPHFSGLVGVVHNVNITFWQSGELASDGIRQMAEEGKKVPLQAEFAAAREHNNAGAGISGGDVNPSPGSITVEFEATPQFPLVTLVTMVAPSPDWFVGTQSLSLQDAAGAWRNEIIVELLAHDAGTDGGPSYSSPNNRLSNPVAIAPLKGAPFRVSNSVPSLGTFTFQRQ